MTQSKMLNRPQSDEEVLIHRIGSIRKMDGLLNDYRPDAVVVSSDGGDGLAFFFYRDSEALPFYVRVLTNGDQGAEIRDAVMKSLNFHLNREW